MIQKQQICHRLFMNSQSPEGCCYLEARSLTSYPVFDWNLERTNETCTSQDTRCGLEQGVIQGFSSHSQVLELSI